MNSAPSSCDVFRTSTWAGFGRLKKVFTQREYRRLEFRSIGKDIRMNCIAGGSIFFVGDVLAQLTESRWDKKGSKAIKESKHRKDEELGTLDSIEVIIEEQFGGIFI